MKWSQMLLSLKNLGFKLMSYEEDQKNMNARTRKDCDEHVRKTKEKFMLVFQEAIIKSDERYSGGNSSRVNYCHPKAA